MPRNASGSYTLPSGNPVVSGTLIDATWANNTLADLGNEVTDSLSRSGEGAMLAPLRITDGVQATPSLAFSNEPSSGLYRAGSNEWWAVAAGVQNLRFTNTGLTTRAAAGAVGTPSIAAFNDVDTGIYFPGANELAIATGGAARMTFDSAGAVAVPGTFTLSGGTANGVLYLNGSKVATSGSALTFDGTNLGIGTASPAAKLDVSGQARATSLAVNAPSAIWNSGEIIRGLSSVATAPAIVGQITGGASTPTYVSWNNAASGTRQHMLFADGAGGSTRGLITTDGAAGLQFAYGTTEGFRLDSSGNLGIGTSSPAQKLHVASAGNNYIVSSNTAGSTSALLLGSESGQNTIYSWTTVAGSTGRPLAFYTGASESMRLDSSGNLGIGTASPVTNLHVYKPTATQSGVQISSSNWGSTISDGMFVGVDNNNAYAYVYENIPLVFATNNTERARITAAGELLVGATATNSGARLDVKGVDTTSSNYCMFFENSSGALLMAAQNDGRWRSGTAAASPYNYVVGATNRDLYVQDNGDIGYVSSVLASKTNITPVADTDWLLQLNPVTFNFRKRDEEGNYTDEADGPIKHGLIAEEVEAVNPDLCFYDDVANGGTLRGVNYSHLITPMLKLIQKQQAAIAILEAKVAALEAE